MSQHFTFTVNPDEFVDGDYIKCPRRVNLAILS